MNKDSLEMYILNRMECLQEEILALTKVASNEDEMHLILKYLKFFALNLMNYVDSKGIK